MKKVIGIAVLSAFILAFSGCANTETPQRNKESSAPPTAIQEIEESKSSEESSAVSFSESNEGAESTPSAMPETTQTEVSQPIIVENSESEKQTTPPADESRSPEPETPTTPEPPPEPPTTPSVEKPPKNEPPETAPPIKEEPAVPEFNIQTWIDYAAEYAGNVGLNLSPDATACWDNPITAGSHCLYLERDIQSRLNRYSRDGEITDVWIWAEKRSDGSYDLYIGYA